METIKMLQDGAKALFQKPLGGIRPKGGDPFLDPEISGDSEKRSADGVDFGNLLLDGLKEVSGRQMEVKKKMEGLVTGETKSVEEVMAAMGKSDIAFKLMLEIRSRLVEAWKEVTRIQV
ncbi:MAG TPA: flagellar hook-basal body complex protein FliE [Planctomycetes bacterium]|nr:flagellar hook-basal body complex protein FliE [Planctomycetota bacterium]